MPRVTLNLPDDLFERVKQVAKKDSLTATDIFRRSLELDLFLDKEEDKGSKILIKRENGPMVEIFRHK